MTELVSSFNPELAASRWAQTFEKRKPRITNHDLFELANDVWLLQGGNSEEDQTVGISYPVGGEELRVHNYVEIHKPRIQTPGIETLEVSVDGGKRRSEWFQLRHHIGRNRFSTSWIMEANSVLAEGYIDEGSYRIVRLKPSAKRTIARNIWRAYLHTAPEIPQQQKLA